MAVVRSSRRFSARRLAASARDLLEASTLCAISTVGPGGRAHVNTAYFAWAPTFDLVWLSAPQSTHSRNLERSPSVAVAVYDSTQAWGGADRGIQLFGRARQARGASAREAAGVYAARFPDFRIEDFAAYGLYRMRPRRMKLFDERALGGGVFVTALVGSGGRLEWSRTELYGGS